MLIPLLLACESDPVPAAECASSAAPAIDIEGAVAGTREDDTSYVVPWTGETRDIVVHAWYATDDTSGEAARWLDVFEDANSWVGASVRPTPQGCLAPLVVYSHGSQAWAGNASPILHQLVNAGWVAAGPDHTDNLLTQDEEVKPETFPLLRTLDVRATIDWIEALPEGDPLHSRVDTSRVLVFGHSYGGQTSWLLGGPSFDAAAIGARCAGSEIGCTDAEKAAYAERAVDERIVAVAPLAGTAGSDLVAESGWDTLDRPVLFMTGSADGGGEDAFARTSAGDITWVNLEGGCHESFTATPIPCGLDKTLGLTVAATYIADFAVREVLGSDDAEVLGVLDGTIPVDAIVTLSRSR